MSKDHEGDLKQYIHTLEAWYAKSSLGGIAEYVDEVMFGFYAPGDGTSGEMCVRWYPLTGEHRPIPKLECFDDAWHALAQFKDVIDAMADLDGMNIQPKDFCLVLERCGFTDRTPRRYEDSYSVKT